MEEYYKKANISLPETYTTDHILVNNAMYTYLSIEEDLLLFIEEMIRKDLIPFDNRLASKMRKRAGDLRDASDVLTGSVLDLDLDWDDPEIRKMWEVVKKLWKLDKGIHAHRDYMFCKEGL